MINPISKTHPSNARPADVRKTARPPAEAKPDPRAQTAPVSKSGALSHDQVTLRSAGQPDTDP
jgi:hypothetical protein